MPPSFDQGWVDQPHGTPPPPAGMPFGWVVQCRFCGCVPAAITKFRGHQGFLIIMRFLSLDGPFCRDCGLATFRRMTANTLVAGWWGALSFFITPVTVLINLVRRRHVAELPPPMPPASGPYERPMDPGRPLLARPTGLIGSLLAAAFVLLFFLGPIIDGTY